jgi:hypothetical protein
MTLRNSLIAAASLVALAGAWLLFRPELLLVNKEVHEEFSPAPAADRASGPRLLTAGTFHGVAHTTTGTASLYQTEGGKRVLRLTDFETSNGPAVRVLLIAAGDAADADTVKRAAPIDLGELKGNRGDQNYDVPADADLSRYRAVTIWCARFDVNFATAPLTTPEAGAVKVAQPPQA